MSGEQTSNEVVTRTSPTLVVAQHRPMPFHLRQLLGALEGSDGRAPLVYSGDTMSSLQRLRHDLQTHHSGLAYALGEPQRPDYPFSNAIAPVLDAPSASQHPLELHALQESPQLPQLSQLSAMIHPHSHYTSQLYPHHPLTGFHAAAGLTVNRPGLPSLMQWHPTLRAQMANTGPHRARLADISVHHRPQDSLSEFTSESSTLVWPPVGATFQGQRSRLIPTGPRDTIDNLADLQYRKPRLATFEELCKPAEAGPAVRRLGHLSKAQDQLDLFLRDYVKGHTKPASLTEGAQLSSHDNLHDTLHGTNAALHEFANSGTRGYVTAR